MGGENTNNAPRTLKDIKDAEENEEGAEDKPQEWYTGGASSGQNVIDPSKLPQKEHPENGDDEFTDSRYGNMFREALRHGARHRQDDDTDEENTTTRSQREVFFSGRGRKMTEEEKEEEDDALDGCLLYTSPSPRDRG